VGTAFTAIGLKAAKAADDLADLALVTNIGVEDLQAYAYAAAMRGAELLDHAGWPGGEAWRRWANDLRDRFRAAFWVEDEFEDEAGVVERRRRVLSGEAWDSSRIILSWEDVLEAARAPGEGYNVALHEFAHYLDAEGAGVAEGNRGMSAWAADLALEFDAMLDAVDRGEYTFLDPYAAEDEAEFFAVATEDFFDRAAELRAAHPRLYALLQEFYALDPAAWT
jgi:Mlc titration factor MtfA (ptsG expression regulator)